MLNQQFCGEPSHCAAGFPPEVAPKLVPWDDFEDVRQSRTTVDTCFQKGLAERGRLGFGVGPQKHGFLRIE